MMQKITVFLSLFVMASCELKVVPGPNATLTTYKVNETVVGAEPPEDYEKVALNDSVPVSVNCVANFTGIHSVTWYRDGKVLTKKDFSNEKIWKVITDANNINSTLHVYKPSRDHAAAYVCEFTTGTASVNTTVYINSPPLIAKFEKAKRAIQGDRLKVSCDVAGYPKPDRVIWFFSNTSTEYVSRDGVTTETYNDVAEAKLLFAHLQFNDRGVYYCTAKNAFGEDVSGVLVRAKDRLDALWPFLCIVAEVIILVTIILIYEKKRSSGAKKPTEANGAAGAGTGDQEDEDKEVDPEDKDVEKDDVHQVTQRAVKT